MSLHWYIRRAMAMSVPEVAHRLAEKTRKIASRRRDEGWQRYMPVGIEPLPGLRENLLGAVPALRAVIAQAAARVLSGRFEALGMRWPDRAPRHLFPAHLWHLDPATGALWPGHTQYCFDIPYRHEQKLGDVKFAWEINRLQFLQPLAAHAQLTGDPDAVRAIEEAIASWYDANPPFRGLAWNSGIELALRAISLLLVVTLVGEQLSETTIDRIGRMLHAHAHWIERFPSRFSSANNHRIAELTGLYLIGRACPGIPRAATIAEVARRQLSHEIMRQILADGVPAEQSPTYGAFSAELALVAATVAERLGEPLPRDARRRLRAFSLFVEWIADRGRVPAIGDDDEGRVVTLGGEEPTYAVSVATGIVGTARATTSLEVHPTDFRACLLGAAASPSVVRPKGIRIFADGGYTAFRGRMVGHDVSLTFDHGPLGYLAIAAHGHADALSLTMSIDGRPVLVDPGTYLYHSGREWRDWFRGTRAHNTLNIEGANQSEITGPFNWSRKARATLVEHRDGESWMLRARHDGFCSRFGVVHERTLRAVPEGIAIEDRLVDADDNLESELVFQFAPGLSISADGTTVIAREAGTELTRLYLPPGDVDLDIGRERGWVSPSFGRKVAAPRVAWKGRVGSMPVVSLIWIGGLPARQRSKPSEAEVPA